MKKSPINRIFANDTTNIIMPSEAYIDNGIPFGTEIISDILNGTNNLYSGAIQFNQLASGVYVDTQIYPIRSIIKCLYKTDEGLLSAKWFMKLTETVAGLSPILNSFTTVNDVIVYDSANDLDNVNWQSLDIGSGGGVTEADKSETGETANNYKYIVTTLANGVKTLELFAEVSQESGQVNFPIPLPFRLLKNQYTITEGSTANNYIVSCLPVVNSRGSLIQVNVSTLQGSGTKGWVHVKGIIDLAELPLAPSLTSLELSNRVLNVIFDKVDSDTTVTTNILAKKSVTGSWEILESNITSPYSKTFTEAELPDNSVWEIKLSNEKNGNFDFTETVNMVQFGLISVAFNDKIGAVENIIPDNQFPLTSFDIEYYNSDNATDWHTAGVVASSSFQKVDTNRIWSSENINIFGVNSRPNVRMRPIYKVGKSTSNGVNYDTTYTKPTVTAPVLSYVVSTKTLNWTNPDSSSIGFKLYKNDTLLQDNLTALTFTDDTMDSGDKYYVVGYKGLIKAKSNEIIVNLEIVYYDDTVTNMGAIVRGPYYKN